jgi:hypothetical protein
MLPQGAKAILSSGQKFVGVTLMSHIPYHTIPGKFEDAVKGNRQLDHSQIRGKVSPGPRNRANNLLSDLRAKFFKLLEFQSFDIRRATDLIEQPCHEFVTFLTMLIGTCFFVQ